MLSPLFDEYLAARERYYFLRERVKAASQGAVMTVAAPPIQTMAATAPSQVFYVTYCNF